MTRARTLQRLVIAEALVQGTRIATIASNLRVSRSWASREANAPQTRVMLASMLNNRAESIARPTALVVSASAGRTMGGRMRSPYAYPASFALSVFLDCLDLLFQALFGHLGKPVRPF